MPSLTSLPGVNKFEQEKWTFQSVRYFSFSPPVKLGRTAFLPYSCRVPFYTSMGLWSPEDKEKQKPKPQPCLSLRYCPRRSQCANPPEAPWGICDFSIATEMYMQAAQLCLRKKSLAYLLNRAKWNNVFDKQPCIRTEVSGRKKSGIRKEGQSCGCSTQMNSGDWSLSTPSVKISLCAPDKSLSAPPFPMCEGPTMSPLSILAIQNITSFGAGTVSFNDYAKPPLQHGLRSEDNS